MGRQRGERQVLTTADIGTLSFSKDGKMEVNAMKKCSICGEAYFLYNPKNGTAARKPNEWTEQEELAHKISHVDSVRARRILGSLTALPNSDREAVLKFVHEHYAGE